MSAIWLMVLAAGVTPFQPSDPSALAAAQASDTPAAVQLAVSPGAPAVDPAARSPQQLRESVVSTVKRLDAAKRGQRASAIIASTDLYRELSTDRQLSPAEHQRLAKQLRTRLQRCAAQMRYESNHATVVARSSGTSASGTSTSASASTSSMLSTSNEIGVAGGPAAENLDQLVNLIQTTLGGPDNWLPPQKAVNQVAGQGNNGFGNNGFGQNGQNGQNGGRAGGAGNGMSDLDRGAQANGEALVDLIEKTIAPESWDLNGGPGSIVYYGNFRALVVRQSEEGQENVGNLLKALGK